MNQGDRCESWGSPARSETLHTPGSFLHRSWEISAEPGATTPGSSGKAIKFRQRHLELEQAGVLDHPYDMQELKPLVHVLPACEFLSKAP